MRAATTVKKHAAKAAEVEAANLIRQNAQERIWQHGNNGGEICEGEILPAHRRKKHGRAQIKGVERKH